MCVCVGMGVCLPVRGPVSGRARLCWDSQLLHGAVPGRAVGFVRVYWQPVCVPARVHVCLSSDASARMRGCRSSGVDLLSLSVRHLRKDVAEAIGGDDLRQLIVTLTAAFRSHLAGTLKLELCSLICSFNL